MRKRITFIQQEDAPFKQSQAILTSASLSIHDLDAAREERISFSFDELSEELLGILEECQALHLRWATERQYDAVAPFSSRVAPGLHAFYVPVAADTNGTKKSICTLLGYFGHEDECTAPEITLTTLPKSWVERKHPSAASPSYQFYTRLPSLDRLIQLLQYRLCGQLGEECQRHLSTFLLADSLDADFDGVARTVTVSGYWSSPRKGGWTEQIKRHEDPAANPVEVGLLASQNSFKPEELKVGGFLAVVGRDDNLKPTLFSFPSRHHPLPVAAASRYTVSFPPPTGLHPTMTISLPREALRSLPQSPPNRTCKLYTYLTLPSSIFADKYQLSTTDPLFLESHNLVALHAVSGETDLEAPDWAVSVWGSTWLLELSTPHNKSTAPDNDAAWNITVPLHLRYLPPSESGYRTASVPWPVAFWACSTSEPEEVTRMGVNPFDRVHLGWDRLFGPKTLFYQMTPDAQRSPVPGRLVEEIEVPVLRLRSSEHGQRLLSFGAQTIQFGTVIVAGLGFLWIVWKLGVVLHQTGYGSVVDGRGGRSRPRDEKQEKKDK